ncbi:MAG: NAD-dependent epimerase/dehydratase family protein [Thiotrichaceae bacterium]
MKILLTGSSGFIGQHIKAALLRSSSSIGENHTLLAPSHKEADFNSNLTIEDWLPLLEEVDVVINSVGIIVESKDQLFSQLHTAAPIALFKACVKSGVKRVIQISALGADEQAFTPYQISKYRADKVLRDLPLLWFVLRPSLVYGEGGKSSAMFKRLASLKLIPLPDAGKQLIQPVHISDLVAVVEQCLREETQVRKTIDVVGPKAMTLADYLQAIRASMGKTKAKIVAVPIRLSLFAASVGYKLIPLFHPDNMHMLMQGNVADVKPLEDFLGRLPLTVEKGFAQKSSEFERRP